MTALFPRRYPAVDVVTFRTTYIAADPSFAKLHMLDSELAIWVRASRLIEHKENRLMIGMALLGFAIVPITLSLVLR